MCQKPPPWTFSARGGLRQQVLAMMWQYLNNDGQFHSGTCTSTLEILADGRYRLHEEWQLIGSTQETGKSVIEEVG